MREKRKTEKEKVSFSYLDVFILLLLGLVLSCFVYLATANQSSDKKQSFRVDLVTPYEEILAHSIPAEGEILFDAEGEKIGMIESVSVYETEGADGMKTEICFGCAIAQTNLKEGEVFVLETEGCILETEIIRIEPNEGGEKTK